MPEDSSSEQRRSAIEAIRQSRHTCEDRATRSKVMRIEIGSVTSERRALIAQHAGWSGLSPLQSKLPARKGCMMYRRRGFDGQSIIDEVIIAQRAQNLFNAVYQGFGGNTVAIVATAHRFELVPEGEWNPSICARECAAWGIDVAYLREASRRRRDQLDQEYRATTRQRSA